jgi:hypothetical protein
MFRSVGIQSVTGVVLGIATVSAVHMLISAARLRCPANGDGRRSGRNPRRLSDEGDERGLALSGIRCS